MTENLLRHEVSPYLLQHKDNPVHWRPWGPDALNEARENQKPILLSVGYAACHWCHVMAHESFEDPATADVMNNLFVNIKVDREERPDIDQIYMAALHALGEQGGWPLTMFLTPEGAPFWGGTYFPPTARYGRPGFTDVLKEVSRIFRDEPDKIDHNRKLLIERLTRTDETTPITLDRDLLDRAAERLLQLVDRHHGGINGAPKFPQAGLLELLWRAGQRTGNPDFHDAVLVTLRNICSGGIYDHIGGGFARYSVDSRWLVPHFEKMLYDNAQLIELLAYAHIKTGESLFLTRIEETIAWLDREMRTDSGTFAASLDADSEGHEGRFYVWTPEEIADVLGAEEGAFFSSIYDIAPGGNWEGVSIPNRLARQSLLDEQTESRLSAARVKLLARRETRTRPARDDKVLADWNGLVIAAIATAGNLLERRDWVDMAIDTYRALVATLSYDDRLAHAYRAGKKSSPGLATDYAAVIKAALSLYTATGEAAYLTDAERCAAVLQAHHWDPATPGYFLSADDAEALLYRPRSNVDEATPSANAVMGANLVRLWHLTGKDEYRRIIDDMLQASSAAVASNLFAAAGTLNALDLRLNAVDLILVVPDNTDPSPMLREIRRLWSQNSILSTHRGPVELPATHPATGKTAIDGKPTVYVCRGETCSLPLTEPEGLAGLI